MRTGQGVARSAPIVGAARPRIDPGRTVPDLPEPAANSVRLVVAAFILCAAALAARADGGEDLVKARGCTICHDVDRATVGPAFKAIAKKYADDPDAKARIAAKLRSGSGHVKPSGSDQDVDDLVTYVLSLH